MTAASVALLLGLLGAIGSGFASLFAIARARRVSRRTGRLPRSVLALPLVLGVVLVLSIVAIVAAVVLR